MALKIEICSDCSQFAIRVAPRLRWRIRNLYSFSWSS